MTHPPLAPPSVGDWIGVSDQALPVDEAWKWASLAHCGGIVTFCGLVRDHSEHRPGVTSLEYEAYLEYVVPRLTEVATQARERWSDLGRLVLLHRVGMLNVGDVAVVVTASTPHRAESFETARFCIDTLKHTLPIWKHETWEGGSEWSACAHDASPFGASVPPVQRPTKTS